MRKIKSFSQYSSSDSFSISIPIYSKIKNILLSNSYFNIIYEYDTVNEIDKKYVYFFIKYNDYIDCDIPDSFEYFGTVSEVKSQLEGSSGSVMIRDTKMTYHIFYNDKCIREERNTKIEEIVKW